jgi:hypothetical protein
MNLDYQSGCFIGSAVFQVLVFTYCKPVFHSLFHGTVDLIKLVWKRNCLLWLVICAQIRVYLFISTLNHYMITHSINPGTLNSCNRHMVLITKRTLLQCALSVQPSICLVTEVYQQACWTVLLAPGRHFFIVSSVYVIQHMVIEFIRASVFGCMCIIVCTFFPYLFFSVWSLTNIILACLVVGGLPGREIL